jgi:zinc transport system substrate-binding protein
MLLEIDPENAQTYRDNADAYIARLSALDAEFQAAVDEANVMTLVFADRFPFQYMMDDYGLSYYAAFRGCSAESEASFITIISLANRINQLGLNIVMVTESSDQSIARTVIDNTDAKNQRILVMNAAHSVTVAEAGTGVTYLSIMQSNLAVLKEAMR